MSTEKTLYEKRSAKQFLVVYRQLEPGTPWELIALDPLSTMRTYGPTRRFLARSYQTNLRAAGFAAAQVQAILVPRGTTIPTVTDSLDTLTKETPDARSS